MSRVTTLADIRTEEISVQSLVLRERPVEDVSVQTSLSDIPNSSNPNESLREIVRQRLERGESNLPLRPNLNENLDEEARIDILNSIVNDNYRSDLVQTILSNFSEDTLTRLVNTLQGPVNSLEA